MNVEADTFLLNDLDREVIGLHEFLCAQAADSAGFFKSAFELIDAYGLSCSYLRDDVPQELKERLKKTYFAEFNRESFGRLKNDFNSAHRQDHLYLYILLIYGFNRMLRFNRRGEYNLPVGNVDFNKNTFDALSSYFELVARKNLQWSTLHFDDFLKGIQAELTEEDLVYLDPPYLITFSEYNKYWNEQTECELLARLDDLDQRNVRFAISNVTHYKGRENRLFIDWSKRYNPHSIKSNYISYHDNSIKKFNEVLVTNY